MHSHPIQRRGAMALIATTAVLPAWVAAQNFPSRPITIVVPYPPGGTTDVLARALGEKLSQSLGQPVIVESKPGAGATLGADLVHALPELGRLDDLHHLGVEARDDVLRRHRRREDAEPGADVEALQTRLVEGRHVGQHRGALAGGDRQGAQLAALDVLQHRRHGVE